MFGIHPNSKWFLYMYCCLVFFCLAIDWMSSCNVYEPQMVSSFSWIGRFNDILVAESIGGSCDGHRNSPENRKKNDNLVYWYCGRFWRTNSLFAVNRSEQKINSQPKSYSHTLSQSVIIVIIRVRDFCFLSKMNILTSPYFKVSNQPSDGIRSIACKCNGNDRD